MLFYFSAPNAVQNLSGSSNGTHILISWSAPANPNGIVTYSVVVMERDLLTNDTNSIASETMVTELQLVVNFTVKPYSEYTVNVTPQTSAGMGDSTIFPFQSPEEGNVNIRSYTMKINEY